MPTESERLPTVEKHLVALALNSQKAIEQANYANGAYRGVVHRYPSQSEQATSTALYCDRSQTTSLVSDRSNQNLQVATGYYFGSIRRVDIDELPLPEKLEPAYLDTLIQQTHPITSKQGKTQWYSFRQYPSHSIQWCALSKRY